MKPWDTVRWIAARLPSPLQIELNRFRYERQIRAGRFVPDEPEIHAITELVSQGDIVIDVGANIGHYTVHMSRCVGPSGRVIAIEPIPETFALLAHNVHGLGNVSLFNVAIADSIALLPMSVPRYGNGGKNYYRARIDSEGSDRVMSMRLDSIAPPRVKLIKVDAEGHDLDVLKSAEQTIERDRPVIVVEAQPESDVTAWLQARGYRIEHTAGSPNVVAIPSKD